MADYIPKSDADFDTWQETWFAYVSANGPALGLTTAQVNDVGSAHNAWTGNYGAQQTALNAAQTATSAKNAARDLWEALIRVLTALIQAGPATTDDQRNALGVTVPGGASVPAGPPASQPVLNVDMGTRLMHVVSFADAGTPTSKAKPAGVMGCELWEKIGGPAPVSNAGMTFLAVDTRTPYTTNFEDAAVGQTVYYLGRWVSTQGEHGPWGTVISATVGG